MLHFGLHFVLRATAGRWNVVQVSRKGEHFDVQHDGEVRHEVQPT